MKIQSKISDAIIAMTQSKWTRPALMALVLIVVLGLTGCEHPH